MQRTHSSSVLAAASPTVAKPNEPLRRTDSDEHLNPLQWSSDTVVTDGTPHAVILRALSTDNHLETKKVLNLFQEYYGAGYPFEGVLDLEYWQRQLSANKVPLVSIAAEEGGEFIAHLGLHYDTNRRRIELVYPALHPSYAGELSQISELYWRKLELLSRRQQWRCLYQYTCASEADLQKICAQHLHSFVLALIPGVGPQPEVHGGALLTYHLLPELVEHQMATEPPRLYPPAHHLKKIQELYTALGLKRVFLGMNSNEPAKKTPHPGCTRSLTLESRFLVDEFPVTPSTLTSPFTDREALLQELFSTARPGFSRAEKHLVQISLNDERTPDLCQALEEEGYSFVGILPMCCGTDYILYSHFERGELESMPPLSRTADALRRYMVNKQ